MIGYSTALVIKESHITTVNTLLCAQTAPSVPSDWKKLKGQKISSATKNVENSSRRV